MLAEPHEDPELMSASLAGAITTLFARDIDAMGAAARRHVEAHYSWTRALQSLMSRYQAVVTARRSLAIEGALPSAGTIQ